MDEEGTQATLRDQLSAAFDAVEAPETPPEGVVADAAPIGETPEQAEVRLGRTAGRPRDAQGRLLPGKPVKDSAPEAKAETPPVGSTEPPAAEAKPRPKYPSTWKKGFEAHWESLDPSVADEIARREGDYAKGVSTYKQEADRAKVVWDTIAPYQPLLQQHGIDPVQHIGNLFRAHQMLATGSPQDRLSMFAKLAQDYQIPLQSLIQQGQDGQFHLIQPQPYQAPQFDPNQVQSLVQRQVQEHILAERTQSAIQEFEAAKDSAGNPAYPHYQTVKATMAQLLESGLAQDLPSAYDAALRLPQHAPLYEAQQQQQRDAEEKARAEAAQRQAAAARAKAVSTRSNAPTSAVKNTAPAKGIRANLEAAFDELGGRV